MIRHALSVLLLLGATACGLADNERDEKNRRVYLNFYDKAFEAFCLGESVNTTSTATGASPVTRRSAFSRSTVRSGASRR